MGERHGWTRRLVTLVLIVSIAILSSRAGVVSGENAEEVVKAMTELLTGDQQQQPKQSKSESEQVDQSLSAPKTSFNFIHAFFASLSVIVVSEIGDKTFFIAAIMAMKHPRCTVYMGAMFALGLMTLLSALLGNILTKLIPKVYTYYASSVLFALFGLKMLREGWQMDASDASEEYEEASSTLREQEEKNSSSLEIGSPG